MALMPYTSSPNGLLVSQSCCQACPELADMRTLHCICLHFAPAGTDRLCRNNVLDIFELRSLLEQTNGGMEDSIFVSVLLSSVLVP